MPTGTIWRDRLKRRIANLNRLTGMPSGIPDANAKTVALVVQSSGASTGALCVANIASAHVPDFCAAKGAGYLNAYDLVRLGKNPGAVSATRNRVDKAISTVASEPADRIYFLAAELNGTGIRFYGDLCLVLNPAAAIGGTTILETNSYDLVRPPRSARTRTDAGLKAEANDMSGSWAKDLPAIAAIKLFAQRQDHRRVTTGSVSDALLDDEDYIEVLRIGAFGVGDLKEARLSASGVAQDGRIDERTRFGPVPDAAALMWRAQRREAERELAAAGVPVRVVTTSGRARG